MSDDMLEKMPEELRPSDPSGVLASRPRGRPGMTLIEIAGPHLILQAHPTEVWTEIEAMSIAC